MQGRPTFISPGAGLFTPEEERIAQVLQRKRLQMILHCYIYHCTAEAVIDKETFQDWAQDLLKMQKQHPEIAKKVFWPEYFMDWDGQSGAHFPFDNPWVQDKALGILDSARRAGCDTKRIRKGEEHQTPERNAGKTNSQGNRKQADSKQRSHRLF